MSRKPILFVTTGLVAVLLLAWGCKKEWPAIKRHRAPGAEGAAAKGGGGSGYQVLGSVPNGGSVKGTITYTGSKADGTVAISKDQSVCGAKGTSVPEGSIVVAGGKLKNAVVMLEGIKAGKAFPSDAITVDNVTCMFHPRVAAGKLGGKVVARNSDTVLHNTHLFQVQGAGRKNVFNIALPNQGQAIEKPLRKPGLIDVRCDAHEWMQAYVWVVDHPYVALTDASGAFDIGDVPPGTYKVRVWHEKVGETVLDVTVAAGQAAALNHAFN